MRILVIGESYPDSFADNVSASLLDGGHEVRTVSPFRTALSQRGRLVTRVRSELPAFPRIAAALQTHVIHAAEEFRPDLALSLDYRLAFRTVAAVRRLGASCAFWFPDAPGNLGRETHVLAPYDALFVKDTAVASRYRELLGLNAHFLPEACNPRWHRPPADVTPGDHGPALLVVGNLYATRFALLSRLARAGIPLRFHGPAWPRWLPRSGSLGDVTLGPYLARSAKARSFRGAFAVLNSMATHEGDGANCRLFEAAGCGGVVLTEERARLREFFESREVRSYSSFCELIESISEVRAMEFAERREFGDAAARRAHSEHTYLNRFQQIIDVLGQG